MKLSIPSILLLSIHFNALYLLWVPVDSFLFNSPSSISWKVPRPALIGQTKSDSSVTNIYIAHTAPVPSIVLFPPLYAKSGENNKQGSHSESSASINGSNNNTIKSTDNTTRSTTDSGLLPSYNRLIIFTATTILIWLSEPLLSLVDTTIVSLTASPKNAVLQIAALGPATTLFDSLIYTTYFLAIATTNQLAPALATAASLSKESNTNGNYNNNNTNTVNPWQQLRRSTSHLLGLSLVFGCIVSAITFAVGKPVISQMVGGATNLGAAEANAIVPLATNYAKIRAVVAPFSVVGFVAETFCLTTLDIKTPVIAVATASIVNIIGDLALSPTWGIQGAAVATAMATVTSCLIMLRRVRKTTTEWKSNSEKYEILQAVTTTTTTTTTNAKLVQKSNDIPFWSLPDKKSTVDLLKLAGPIFFVMMAKVACYNVMTVRATNFGIVPLASHNIMMRIFFFFACFGDSLSQAAQSFYPQVSKKLRGKLIKRLFYISSVVGICNYFMSQLTLSKFGRFLAKDSNIIGIMAKHSPWVGYAVLLHPFISLLEGTVLAQRDLVFLVGSYLLTSLLHFGSIYSPSSSTFMGLWRALFGFQFIRLVQFAIRVWSKSRQKQENYIGATEQEGIPAPPL